jgi:hypothetical protein
MFAPRAKDITVQRRSSVSLFAALSACPRHTCQSFQERTLTFASGRDEREISANVYLTVRKLWCCSSTKCRAHMMVSAVGHGSSAQEPSPINHVACTCKKLPHELLLGPCGGLESYRDASSDTTESIRADEATTTAICSVSQRLRGVLDVRPNYLKSPGYKLSALIILQWRRKPRIIQRQFPDPRMKYFHIYRNSTNHDSEIYRGSIAAPTREGLPCPHHIKPAS